MTIPRFLVLLALFAGLGMAVVALRADQVSRSHHIQEIMLEQTTSRRTMRSKEMDIARLRSPTMIRDRARRFELPVDPPHGKPGGLLLPPDESWLVDQ